MTLQIGDLVRFHNPELKKASVFEGKLGIVVGRRNGEKIYWG